MISLRSPEYYVLWPDLIGQEGHAGQSQAFPKRTPPAGAHRPTHAAVVIADIDEDGARRVEREIAEGGRRPYGSTSPSRTACAAAWRKPCWRSTTRSSPRGAPRSRLHAVGVTAHPPGVVPGERRSGGDPHDVGYDCFRSLVRSAMRRRY